MITTLTIGSVTLGTYASGYLFGGLEGFGFPEVRVDVKNRGNYDGARLGVYNYGRRIMRIEGEIIGDDAGDYEDKRQALETALNITDGLQTVTFTTRGGLSLQADVIINAMFEAPYAKGMVIRGEFRIELVAPYPYLLSQSEVETTVNPYIGGGGAIPSAIPFSLGTGGTGATSITNSGNGHAYPTIKIYGAVENPSIQNSTTDKTLSFTYTLTTPTDYIEIDMYNRTALLNGVTNVRRYASGDWWTLQPGANSVKLTSGGAQTGYAEITHRHSYLGV